MSTNLRFLEHPNVYLSSRDETIAYVKLTNYGRMPADASRIPVTAEQITTAVIESHDNTGRSKVTLTLRIECEALGTPEDLREYFNRRMLDTIRAQADKIDSMRTVVREQVSKIEAFEADRRAAAVVESARIACGKGDS